MNSVNAVAVCGDRISLLPAPVAWSPGDKSPPLVCQPVFEELCVNANGDIVCSSCDVNGQRVYGNVFVDRINDVYNGPMYQEIREWLLRSRPDTWCPAITRQCSRRAAPATPELTAASCRVKTLKLEPVTYCNLKCPACPVELNFKQDLALRATRGRKLLPLQTMLDVVDQLPDLELILYFNYGEPFLHKDTIPFLREVRRKRPTIKIVTNTNGLVITSSQINALATESLMDRVVFSIDGATQGSYEKYRVGGTASKALAKMKALVDACRLAGTWRRFVTDAGRGVQVTWQYILFDWNDSEEELALAQDIAWNIGVPIEWVITCGFGASKRFLYGSTEAAKLMNGPHSFVHAAAPADLANRLDKNGISAFEFDVYKKMHVSCQLLSLPYSVAGDDFGHQAQFHTDEPLIVAPAGAVVLFSVSVENRTAQTWEVDGSDYLRLGVLLKTTTGETLRELPGAIMPREAATKSGHGSLSLRVTLPEQPGEYELIVDVVQEWICWFSERASPPLRFQVRVD